MTPLGVIVKSKDPIQLPSAMQSAIPKGAAVQTFQKSHLFDQGESFAVYAIPDEDHPEIATDPHIVVFRNNAQAVEFRIAHVFAHEGDDEDDDGGWVFFSASDVPSPGFGKGFMLTFRNIGDGAATRFVLISQEDDSYRVIWKADTTQGRFRLLRNGRFQLWSSNHDGACVWCAQSYDVTTYTWKNKAAVMLSHATTRRQYSPDAIADKPILIDK